MGELEKFIDYLMKRVLEQQERITFLEKHIDSQNQILVDTMEARYKKAKDDAEKLPPDCPF